MGVVSLPLGYGESPESSCPSSDSTPVGREGAFHYCWVGIEVQAGHMVSTDTTGSGRDSVPAVRDESLFCLHGFLKHYPSRVVGCFLTPWWGWNSTYALDFANIGGVGATVCVCVCYSLQ